jgi:hypothetical protein
MPWTGDHKAHCLFCVVIGALKQADAFISGGAAGLAVQVVSGAMLECWSAIAWSLKLFFAAAELLCAARKLHGASQELVTLGGREEVSPMTGSVPHAEREPKIGTQ